jgi:hypothetical protein
MTLVVRKNRRALRPASIYQFLFVDNGSTDNSVCITRETFPAVKVVALKENKGFTGGNAAGLEVAHGAYLALVNNDARPDQI